MSKYRSAREIFEFCEQLGLIWQDVPEKSFGLFIADVMKNPTEIYTIKDKELLKRLSKDT